MKNYHLKPERLLSLDDLYLEQKYAIYILDSILKNHKYKQEFLEIKFNLERLEKMDPKEFLPEEDRKGTGLSDKEKIMIGQSMKDEMIKKLKDKL